MNKVIELARQSGYNEACYIYEKRVEKLKHTLLTKGRRLNRSFVKEEIDKIFGTFNHSQGINQEVKCKDTAKARITSCRSSKPSPDTHAKETDKEIAENIIQNALRMAQKKKGCGEKFFDRKIRKFNWCSKYVLCPKCQEEVGENA